MSPPETPPPLAAPDGEKKVGFELLGLAPVPPCAWLLDIVPPNTDRVELLDSATPPPPP